MTRVLRSVVALLVANHSVEPETASASPWQETINIGSLTGADVQIQRIEHDKTQTLGDLEPALRHQMQLQVHFVNLIFPCHISSARMYHVQPHAAVCCQFSSP